MATQMTTEQIAKFYNSRAYEVRAMYLKGTEELFHEHARSLGYPNANDDSFRNMIGFNALPPKVRTHVARKISAA